MNHFKKFLAMALSVMMIFGATVSLSAKRFDDVANDSTFAEQIDLLSEIGIIVGTSENEFSPDIKVTREQMALLLYRMMLGDDNAGTVNSSPFVDLYDPTYYGAISWAAANEYILGTGDKQFGPKDGIRYQDALTMLVRILGHETERMNKGYPWTYIDAAVKLGLTESLSNLSYTATMTRGQIAALLYNALTADYLIPKNVAGGIYYETTTIIENVFGYSIEEAILTATNDYALPGFDRVIKNNYVALSYVDYVGDSAAEKTIYVNYDELALSADANDKLGERIKVIFTVDDKTKLVTVLGSLEIGRTEHFDTASVASGYGSVTIDDVKYNVVADYSDILGTNNNELLVFCRNYDGSITQLTGNRQLADALGFFSIEMIYDDQGEIASRAILTPYTFGQLKVDKNGGINLAGGLTEAKLTGGLLNPNGAKDGDYVLYHYDSANKALEIKQPLLLIEDALVTRLTAAEATIGGTAYPLGKDNTGITAASIAAQLTVGRKANVVLYQDRVIAVIDAVETHNNSQYLIAMSGTLPVVSDGEIRYFMTANINGVNTGIFSHTATVEAGKIYRYLVDGNGFYHLIPMEINSGVIAGGSQSFIQSALGELAVHVPEANGTTITRGENFYYTLNAGQGTASVSAGISLPVNFLTNDNTVILVNTENGIVVKTGSYSSTITINDGASVTAIFSDRPGSIEMLSYLYISDGELGSVNEGASYAKVYSVIGLEYVDGNVMTVYKAYNFSTGKIESLASPYGSLTVGKTYAIDGNGRLSNIERTNSTGLVTGYADGVITIGGETYRLAEDAVIHSISSGLSVSTLTPADIYMHRVEIFAEGREIHALIAGPALSFSASAADANEIHLTANFEDEIADLNQVKLNSVKFENEAVSNDNFQLTVNGNKIILESVANFEAGFYVISFNYYDQLYIVNCTVE